MDSILGDLDAGETLLLLSAAEKIKECNIRCAIDAMSQVSRLLVITINHPAEILKKNYSKNGIDLTNVYFIDAITIHTTGNAGDDIEHCRYINNPANLTDLGIAITESLKEYDGDNTVVLFDSISTMLVYAPQDNVLKFIHFVVNKMELIELSSVFLAINGGIDPILMMQLSTFVDRIIESTVAADNQRP